MVWAEGGVLPREKDGGRRGWIGDGNGDIGGQVLVFPTAATKRHRSMGKYRRTVLSDFSFSPVDRSSVSS